MNLYDKASLILTPNAYKASKIYVAKPTDGSGDLTFSRASTALRRNSAGLWESVANNVPRLHYPIGGGCPAWLLEPQGTNVMQRSQEVDNAYWTKENATVVANALGNMDKIVETASIGEHRFYASVTNTVTTYTWSISAVAAERSILQIAPGGLAFSEGSDPYANFNLATGIVTAVGAGFTAWMEDEGNGRWRCCIKGTPTSVGVMFFIVNIQTSPTAIRGASYAGIAGNGFYVGDMQLETGSAATSPIITAGSAVTRLKDDPTLTNASSIIGQTEGCIFLDINFIADSTEASFRISDGTNFIYIQKFSDNKFYVGVYDGSFVGSITSGVYSTGRIKIAFGYILNSLVLYINGSLIGTDLSSTIPACDRIFLYTVQPIIWPDASGAFQYNEVLLFKYKPSNLELAALTTL